MPARLDHDFPARFGRGFDLDWNNNRIDRFSQAAVFGSEECELTEELWATTETQKLKEFSEKVSMTTSSIATPPIGTASKGNSTNEPLLQRVRSPKTKMTAGVDVEGEAGRNSTRLHGGSPFSPCPTAAAGAGGESAAPFYSGAFASGGGGDVPIEAISSSIAITGEGFHGEDSAAVTTTTPGTAGTSSENTIAASGTDDEEVEDVGRRGASSAPGDPEITHPERVQ